MLVGLIPRLPLRALPDKSTGVVLLAMDWREAVARIPVRGAPSCVLLELVDVLVVLVMLDAVLRVGVRDGSGSSPPGIDGLEGSCPLTRLYPSTLVTESDRSMSESPFRDD